MTARSGTLTARKGGSLLVVLVVALGSGCALERSSLSIDSDSRVPFFGFQFAPRRRPPAYERSISRTKPSAEPPAKVTTTLLETPPESPWPAWLTRSARPTQPLPRTDVTEEGKPSKEGDTPPAETYEF